MTEAAQRLFALHARLAGGDQTVVDALVSQMLPVLRHRLGRSFPHTPHDVVDEAALDAVNVYVAKPSAFDASRGASPDHFVYGIAWRILRDRLRSEGRRASLERRWAESSQRAYAAQHAVTEFRGDGHIIRRALPDVCAKEQLAAMTAWLTEDDTDVVAVHLGVSHLSLTERRRAVQRLLLLVAARLRRYLGIGPGGAAIACVQEK